MYVSFGIFRIFLPRWPTLLAANTSSSNGLAYWSDYLFFSLFLAESWALRNRREQRRGNRESKMITAGPVRSGGRDRARRERRVRAEPLTSGRDGSKRPTEVTRSSSSSSSINTQPPPRTVHGDEAGEVLSSRRRPDSRHSPSPPPPHCRAQRVRSVRASALRPSTDSSIKGRALACVVLRGTPSRCTVATSPPYVQRRWRARVCASDFYGDRSAQCFRYRFTEDFKRISTSKRAFPERSDIIRGHAKPRRSRMFFRNGDFRENPRDRFE